MVKFAQEFITNSHGTHVKGKHDLLKSIYYAYIVYNIFSLGFIISCYGNGSIMRGHTFCMAGQSLFNLHHSLFYSMAKQKGFFFHFKCRV